MKERIVIIGGGAAGFFTAINIAENNPELEVVILEKSKTVLHKVKISGGGRCNVTNARFTPRDLVNFYPRGKKELLGPFHTFMTGDTMEWFENHDVPLKIEDDLRVFPTSNSSQSIVDCLVNNAKKLGVKIQFNENVISIEKWNEQFKIITDSNEFNANKLVITTGSNPKFWKFLSTLGHTIVKPVPSLFTFNIQDDRIKQIPGISVANATVKVKNSKLKEEGPLLITHWGLSGPVILKLSAWGALEFFKKDYQFEIEINWLSQKQEIVLGILLSEKVEKSKKLIASTSVFNEIPKRLWINLLKAAQIDETTQWAQLSKKQLEQLSYQLTKCEFEVKGKSTFKDEFVSAGGIDLKEINFNRFESKIHKNLFFAGEVLNIDALTGGFNFQNAWTGGYIVAKAIAEKS